MHALLFAAFHSYVFQNRRFRFYVQRKQSMIKGPGMHTNRCVSYKQMAYLRPRKFRRDWARPRGLCHFAQTKHSFAQLSLDGHRLDGFLKIKLVFGSFEPCVHKHARNAVNHAVIMLFQHQDFPKTDG